MDNVQTLKLSFGQECALKLMLEGKNCFLHGNAGTQANVLLKHFEKFEKMKAYLA